MGLSYTLPPASVPPSPAPVDQGTRDLYGYDILFRSDFNLTAGGDYIRVGGKDNLKAAIYRRLITRPGEYRFRPSYGVGIGDFVKKAPTTALLSQLRQRIIEQLLLDERIAEVDVNVTAETVQDTPVTKVFVKVVAGGQPVTFEPFSFAKDAA